MSSAHSLDQSFQPSPALQVVLDEFLALTAFPRPSGQEEAVSNHLLRWAKARDLPVSQDALYNVCIDIPASAGCAAAPLTILQAHMDMVCVGAAGGSYRPATDPVIARRQGALLTAEGSSLGADDGIGIAIILALVQDKSLQHGPLRALFTTQEESSMAGAAALTPQHLAGDYLINVDWEEAGSLCNSCASSTLYTLHCPVTRHSLPPPEPGKRPGKAHTAPWSALHCAVKGLRGGHSGINIHEYRGNAIKFLAHALACLSTEQIPVALHSLAGGIAHNAIPAEAEACFLVPSARLAEAQSLLEAYAHSLSRDICPQEAHFALHAACVPLPGDCLSVEQSRQILDCLLLVHNGVYRMSQSFPGLVESSVNLGQARLDRDSFTATLLARSCAQLPGQDWQGRHLDQLLHSLARHTGMGCTLHHSSPAWAINPHSVLVPMATAAFKAQQGRELRVNPVHAGLECGWFAQKNPHLDMISLGPQLDNVHSPAECLHLDSVPEVLTLIASLLTSLAKPFFVTQGDGAA